MFVAVYEAKRLMPVSNPIFNDSYPRLFPEEKICAFCCSEPNVPSKKIKLAKAIPIAPDIRIKQLA
jgi:hypothetical protein